MTTNEALAITRMKTPANLPLDVLVEIQSYMDPPDIHSLRRVCKSLHSATKNRHVWIQILQRICHVMNVGLDTYPIERMSSLEIEQAASAPFRLSKILDTGLARGRLPRSRKTRVLAAAGAFPNGAEFGAMELAPGGRWLFTLTIYGCIALWDLGTNKKVTALTRPTALWINPRRQETSLSLLEVQVDYGVAHVLITCETPEGLSLTILRVEPGSDSPTFVVFRECFVLEPDLREFDASLFIHDCIAVATKSACLVWDWIKDEWTKFTVDTAWSLSKPFLHDQQVMAWQDEDPTDGGAFGRLAVWRIPPLSPRIAGLQPTVHDGTLPTHVVAPDVRVLDGSLADPCRVTIPFMRERTGPRDLHVLGHTEEAPQTCNGVKFAFRLDPAGLPEAPPTYAHWPSAIATAYPSNKWTGNFVVVPMVDGRELVTTNDVLENGGMGIFIMPGTAEPGAVGHAMLAKTRKTREDWLFDWVIPKFDAVSGRCCLPKSETQIEIRDYVSKHI